MHTKPTTKPVTIKLITKAQIDKMLDFAQSKIFHVPNCALGVTMFQTFLAIKPLLSGKLYWYALAYAYTSSDDLYYYSVDIKLAFSKNEPYINSLMSKSERTVLKELPHEIIIYRGMTMQESESENYGVSWTLDKKIAIFFAQKYDRNYSTKNLKKTVKKLKINKNLAVAYFGEREESEIIFLNKKN